MNQCNIYAKYERNIPIKYGHVHFIYVHSGWLQPKTYPILKHHVQNLEAYEERTPPLNPTENIILSYCHVDIFTKLETA